MFNVFDTPQEFLVLFGATMGSLLAPLLINSLRDKSPKCWELLAPYCTTIGAVTGWVGLVVLFTYVGALIGLSIGIRLKGITKMVLVTFMGSGFGLLMGLLAFLSSKT